MRASVAAFMILAAGNAAAQEKGQIGVAMAYPASLGFVWHVAERLAIRPEVSFGFSSVEVTTTTSSPFPEIPGVAVVTVNDMSTVSPGVSAIFYLRSLDQLTTYVSPRFAYTRTRNNTRVSPGVFGASELTSSSYTYSGAFGAQFSPNRRFSVFGEIGVAFADTSSSSTLSISNGHQLISRGGVGVVFYVR